MKYRDYNDYELIYMIRDGDSNSYNILFEKYIPVMKSIAYSYYKDYKDYGFDYDDFTQEVYIAFNNAISQFKEEKNILFYTFSVVCMRRALLTFCRKITCGRKNISQRYTVNIDDVVVREESNIDNYYNYIERADLVKCMILKLDVEESCILELRYNGFTYKEISVLLDLPLRRVQFKGRKIQHIICKCQTN